MKEDTTPRMIYTYDETIRQICQITSKMIQEDSFCNTDKISHLVVSVSKCESSIEEYHTVALLGRGGYARVYQGIRRTDNKKVAIKVIDKRDVVSLDLITAGDELYNVPREIAIHVRANVVDKTMKIIDWSEDYNNFYLIMETPPSSTVLEHYINQKQASLTKHGILNLFRKLVKHTSDCYKLGIAHRDLSTRNIVMMLDGSGTALDFRVIDFGSAMFVEDEIKVEEEGVFGTSIFLPPELFDRSQYNLIYGAVWTLGIILFKLATGKFPFNTAVEARNSDHEFPVNTQVHYDLKFLVNICLRKEADDRPTLQELFNMVEEIKNRQTPYA